MSDVYIVEAVRTPVGKYKGSLAGVRADHLGAHVLNALVTRAGIRPEEVSDVLFGCVTQVGEQSANIARTALLGAVQMPAAARSSSTSNTTAPTRRCASSTSSTHATATSPSPNGSPPTSRP